MLIRALTEDDTQGALDLYAELTVGPKTMRGADFGRVIAHPGTTVFGADAQSQIISMVTLHILPNVTWGGRPYGVIENVITTERSRGRGVGKAVMEHACAAAWTQNAFKIMLMTGQQRAATGFYEACGFSSEDKTAMIKRADDI